MDLGKLALKIVPVYTRLIDAAVVDYAQVLIDNSSLLDEMLDVYADDRNRAEELAKIYHSKLTTRMNAIEGIAKSITDAPLPNWLDSEKLTDIERRKMTAAIQSMRSTTAPLLL